AAPTSVIAVPTTAVIAVPTPMIATAVIVIAAVGVGKSDVVLRIWFVISVIPVVIVVVVIVVVVVVTVIVVIPVVVVIAITRAIARRIAVAAAEKNIGQIDRETQMRAVMAVTVPAAVMADPETVCVRR